MRPETLTDLDGNEYATVQIGKQLWMAENLNVSRFRNGDPILELNNYNQFLEAGEKQEPACCFYNYQQENGKAYGMLYNWFALIDPRGLAPEGWHIPSDQEWTQLTDYLCGINGSEKTQKSYFQSLGEGAGTEVIDGVAAQMKHTIGWCEDGNGTNSAGFAALPGGYGNCDPSGMLSDFEGIGEEGKWWSLTETSDPSNWLMENCIWTRKMSYNSGYIHREWNAKEDVLSVRCIKD